MKTAVLRKGRAYPWFIRAAAHRKRSLKMDKEMNGKIRLATCEDALYIHNLHTRSVRGLCSGDYPANVIEGWLQGRSPEGYKGIAKNEMYVFEANREIIGWVHVRPKEIVGLFVDAAHARRGVGRALFEYALRIVRQNTVGRIEFEATVTAAPFYESCGCKRLGRSSIRKSSVDVQTVRMELPEECEQIS